MVPGEDHSWMSELKWEPTFNHQMVVATVKVKLRKTGCERPGRQQFDVKKKLQKYALVLQLRNKALANMEDHTKPEQQVLKLKDGSKTEVFSC